MNRKLIKQAIRELEINYRKTGQQIKTSKDVKDYLQLQYAHETEEVFGILYLNTHLEVIEFRKQFYGSIAECTPILRTIVRTALDLNAAKLIFCHNHPSNNCNPSNDDLQTTKSFKKFLDKLDINVLDHIIVGKTNIYSFSEHDQMT